MIVVDKKMMSGISGQLSPRRGEVSHHEEGVEQTDDWGISGQHQSSLQPGTGTVP